MYQPHDFFILRSFGITYASRLNFWVSNKTSLSLGFPLSVGWSNIKLPHFAEADVAAEMDFNFGSGSTKTNQQKLGFFAGPGYSFHVTIIHPAPASTYPAFPVPLRSTIVRVQYSDDASDTNVPVSMFGPTLNSGIRFLAVGHKGKVIEFRFSYMKVLEVPSMLKEQWLYSYSYGGSNLRKTNILKFGCLFSF